MEIKKKEGEQATSLIFRFNKKVQQSGLMKESKKRKYRDRPVSKTKRRQSAIYRAERAEQVKKLKKLGKI